MAATVDFIESGPRDRPLIRIFSTFPGDFQQLHDWVVGIADGSLTSLEICSAQHHWICKIKSLLLVKKEIDRGIEKTGEDCFLWSLRAGTWDQVAYQIEPFTQTKASGGAYRFQWLAGAEAWRDMAESDISLLISTSATGNW